MLFLNNRRSHRKSALALLVSTCAASGSPNIWVAFRYKATQVLFYPYQLRDPHRFTPAELNRDHMPAPLARWGGGGYLLSITPSHLATLQASEPVQPGMPEIHIGDKLTVRLDRDRMVSAVINQFVEQLGGDDSTV